MKNFVRGMFSVIWLCLGSFIMMNNDLLLWKIIGAVLIVIGGSTIIMTLKNGPDYYKKDKKNEQIETGADLEKQPEKKAETGQNQ